MLELRFVEALIVQHKKHFSDAFGILLELPAVHVRDCKLLLVVLYLVELSAPLSAKTHEARKRWLTCRCIKPSANLWWYAPTRKNVAGGCRALLHDSDVFLVLHMVDSAVPFCQCQLLLEVRRHVFWWI